MTSLQTILALIRAIRPSFRNAADRVVIAFHAYILSKNFKLVAAGKAAEDLSEVSSQAEEVGLEGWQDLEYSYAFAYIDAEGKDRSLQVQAVSMDSILIVNVLGPRSKTTPTTISINTDGIVADQPGLGNGYKDLKPMLSQLDKELWYLQDTLTASESTGAAAEGKGFQGESQKGTGPGGDFSSRLRGDSIKNQPDPLRADQEGSRRPGPSVSRDDYLPPDLPSPLPQGMRGETETRTTPGYLGGMHVGPYDPMFNGGGRNSQGLPKGPYPGVRYDPTNPLGMEGFNAEDFQRSRRSNPDMMPPGGGSDFDSVFD